MSGWNTAEINPVARHISLFSPQIFSLSFLFFSRWSSPSKSRESSVDTRGSLKKGKKRQDKKWGK